MSNCRHYNDPRGCAACSRWPGRLGCHGQYAAKNRKQWDGLCKWCGDLADQNAEAAIADAVGPGAITYTVAAQAVEPEAPPAPEGNRPPGIAEPGLTPAVEARFEDLFAQIHDLVQRVFELEAQVAFLSENHSAHCDQQ